jgi:hypothetical protein
VNEERIEMSQTERGRLHWLKLVKARKLTQIEAARRMNVSARWVRQLSLLRIPVLPVLALATVSPLAPELILYAVRKGIIS